jgi:hypothetical protein
MQEDAGARRSHPPSGEATGRAEDAKEEKKESCESCADTYHVLGRRRGAHERKHNSENEHLSVIF